jgi:hypothetical protein
MKKMILSLVTCLFVVSLNAQLLSTPPSMNAELASEVKSDLKVMKAFRAKKQMSRITFGETMSQISVMKQKKIISISVVNADSYVKFTMQDQDGNVLISEKVTTGSIKSYNVSNLAEGQYSLSLTGNGVTTTRLFNITPSQVSLQDEVNIAAAIK